MPVRIEIRRNRILVKGYDLDRKTTQGWLPRMMMVFDSVRHRYEKDKSYSHRLDNGDIIFPRTSDVQPIIRKLMSQNVEIEDVVDMSQNDPDVVPFDIPRRTFELRSGVNAKSEFQAEGIKFLTEKRNPIHFKLLSLPTGEGKTVCGIAAMCDYNRKTLIVANGLTQQWIDEILNKTDLRYDRIYEIHGLQSIEKLLHGRNSDKYDVYVATVQTLMNACKAGIYDEFVRKCGIGLKITDEIHIMTYAHIYVDMMSPIADYIYLSATPARSAANEDFMMRRAFLNLPSYGEEVAQFKKKYLNSIYVMYDSHPKYHEVKKCTTIHGFHCGNFERYTFDKLENRKIVLDILNWAIDTSLRNIEEDDKIAIIVNQLETIHILERELSVMFPGIGVGNYTSDTSPELKRKMLDNKIILSTNKSFGTGSDLRGKLRVLINVTTYSSKVTSQQLPGRLREIPGKKVYYIDLVDQGFKRTYEHYLIRSKIINSFSATKTIRKYGKDV